MTRKELAKLYTEFAENEDAYFEIKVAGVWVKASFSGSPTVESDTKYWRVVVPPKEKWRDKLFKGAVVIMRRWRR